MHHEKSVKTRRGHCRSSGKCANLRTIEEKTKRVILLTILVRPGQRCLQILPLTQPKHTKSPQGTMPHERGSSPVPPSEFSCAALADPKARFCRSLASRCHGNEYPVCRLSKPLTLRHLSTMRTSPPWAWLCPGMRTLACPSTTLNTRLSNLPYSLKKTEMLKRRATSIVTRPGQPCKQPGLKTGPLPRLLDLNRGDAFKLLPDRLGLVLGRILLQRLGRAIHQVLGFLQAQRGNLAHRLDGVDLVRAEVL